MTTVTPNKRARSHKAEKKTKHKQPLPEGLSWGKACHYPIIPEIRNVVFPTELLHTIFSHLIDYLVDDPRQDYLFQKKEKKSVTQAGHCTSATYHHQKPNATHPSAMAAACFFHFVHPSRNASQNGRWRKRVGLTPMRRIGYEKKTKGKANSASLTSEIMGS